MHCDGDFHGEAHHIDALYRCVENELCLFRESRFGICKRNKKNEKKANLNFRSAFSVYRWLLLDQMQLIEDYRRVIKE